jgi:MOSC domain-containing protein YiiM
VYGEALKTAIYDARVKARDFTSPLWGMSGLYAAVVEEGEVRAGDGIEVSGARSAEAWTPEDLRNRVSWLP